MCESDYKNRPFFDDHYFVVQREDERTADWLDVARGYSVDHAVSIMKQKMDEDPKGNFQVIERNSYERLVINDFDILEEREFERARARYETKQYEVQVWYEKEVEYNNSGLKCILESVAFTKLFKDKEEAINFAINYPKEHSTEYQNCNCTVEEIFCDSEEVVQDNGVIYHDGETIYKT